MKNNTEHPENKNTMNNASFLKRRNVSVVIIDDDLPSVEVVREALAKYPYVDIIGTAISLDEGRKLLKKTKPDLVFLDIEYPDGSGLELFTNGQKWGPTRFIFYTQYQKYFHEAFRLRAYDYLLKPFDPDEVGLILERYRLEGQLPGVTAGDICKMITLRADQAFLSVSTLSGDKLIIPPTSVLFFKYDSDRKIWEAIMTTLERHILKRHTTAESILSYGPEFVRTHKSYIINSIYLGEITQTDIKLLPPFNDIDEIKISKNYRRALLERFYDI